MSLQTAVYCYLATFIFYSFYISRRFEHLDVPFYKIIIYAFFCPWMLITHCITWALSKIGIHIIIMYGIEANTPDDSEVNE